MHLKYLHPYYILLIFLLVFYKSIGIRTFEVSMKQLVPFLFILLLFNQVTFSQIDYGRTNIIFNDADDAAIQDLRNYLSPYRAGTITLQKVELSDRTGQEFYLSINGSKTEIRYYLPETVSTVTVIISNLNGEQIKA